MGVRAQNIQTSHQGDLRKTLNKSHPIHRYKANSGNNKKTNNWCLCP